MKAALETAGLVLKYRRFSLGPLDMNIPEGRVTGLVGPNGSGKTTAMRCIAGNLYPDAGRITVLGRPASRRSGSWKQLLGYVPDRPTFIEGMKAGGFLRFLSGFYDSWSETTARKLSERFRLNLDAGIRALSMGERMKLSLVCALARKPRLALFDEPTAGLDPIVRNELFEVLWDLMENEGLTVLISTHIMDDLHRLADDLVFLHSGKIRLQASKDDLIDRWRRMFIAVRGEFRMPDGALSMKKAPCGYELVTRDRERVLQSLSGSGAATVREEAMSMEEIAVEIMKEA